MFVKTKYGAKHIFLKIVCNQVKHDLAAYQTCTCMSYLAVQVFHCRQKSPLLRITTQDANITGHHMVVRSKAAAIAKPLDISTHF